MPGEMLILIMLALHKPAAVTWYDLVVVASKACSGKFVGLC